MNYYIITTPKYKAGLCVDAKNIVWQTANNIKWMREKPLSYIQHYCEKRGWKIEPAD